MAKKRHLHKRFLAPQARRGDGHGYLNQPDREIPPGLNLQHEEEVARQAERVGTHTAMCDEPEAISDGIVSYTETAVKAATLRHAAEVEAAQEARAVLTPERRLITAEARAKAQHVDVSRDLHMVRKALLRARSGGRMVPDAVIRRLERVEARLDGRPLERLKKLAA